MLFSFLFARYFIWDGPSPPLPPPHCRGNEIRNALREIHQPFCLFSRMVKLISWLDVASWHRQPNNKRTFNLNGQNRGLMHRLKVTTTHYKIAPFESTTEEISFGYIIHRLKVRTILNFYTVDWEWANAEAISKEAYVWCSESCNVSYHSDSLSHKKYLQFLKSE